MLYLAIPSHLARFGVLHRLMAAYKCSTQMLNAPQASAAHTALRQRWCVCSGAVRGALLCVQASLPAYANKKGRFHKGSCAGLRAWGLARLVEVKEAGSSSRSKDKDKVSARGGASAGAAGASRDCSGCVVEVKTNDRQQPQQGPGKGVLARCLLTCNSSGEAAGMR